MSLFFDSQSNAPRTHALVIGVGGYPFLPGGATPTSGSLEQVGRLNQLTSPPRSALAVAEFLKTKHAQWLPPVGSVDVLISRAPGDSVSIPNGVKADATIDRIRESYGEWRVRCNSDENNLALFYFCGHGLQEDEQYLLAQDFGQDSLNPWLGAFAFESTMLAMHRCRARTQCFFIDACREITESMKDHNIAVQPLVFKKFCIC
ncbi:MAG: caspase family protein [Pseudomonadota bacterium]